jgi:hypothetical protein
MIEIEGLSARQRAFCDVLWNMETQDEVDRFINCLPPQQRAECQTVLQLIVAATFDQVMDTDLAAAELNRFML